MSRRVLKTLNECLDDLDSWNDPELIHARVAFVLWLGDVTDSVLIMRAKWIAFAAGWCEAVRTVRASL